jgi:predicted ABC-type ATPase
MKTLYIVRGAAGAGKSTLAKKLGCDYHFEADMWFEQFNNGQFDPTRLYAAHQWCQNQTKEAFMRHAHNNTSVVVSNTFTRQWEIEPYRKLAQEIKGVNLIEIIVDKSPFKSIHNVPDEVVQKMQERFEYK